MLNLTNIEWCDRTFNPITGCLHDCSYCYARKQAKRYNPKWEEVKAAAHYVGIGKNGLYDIAEPWSYDSRTLAHPFGFEPTLHRYRLGDPAKTKRSYNIFVGSMADVFGEWVPDEWIQTVFNACEAAPWHNYLFLTKNPGRYGLLNGRDHRYNWEWVGDNWWFGITITNSDDLQRLKYLPYGKTNTFISIEPVLSEIDLSFYLPNTTTQWKCSFCGYHSSSYSLHCAHCGAEGGYSGSFRRQPIHWVIVGAESGNRKDKVIPRREWVADIVDRCRAVEVPVFMKDSLADIWGEPLIQEYPPELQPRPAPRPKRRIHVKCVPGMECCDECGVALQGKPAVRLGVKRYECMTCYEKLEAGA